MNFQDWYTDLADVYRVVNSMDGSLTRHRREKILSGVRCRVFRSGAGELSVNQTAAQVKEQTKLSCDNAVEIMAGDELRIFRGAAIGQSMPETRAFAGEPHHYFEPFGAVIPGLAHQEITLLQEERVKNDGGAFDPEASSAAEEGKR